MKALQTVPSALDVAAENNMMNQFAHKRYKNRVSY